MKPTYIGITDFMNIDEARRMREAFFLHRRLRSKRKLHVGVMTSYKVMNGLPSKYTNTYPKPETISSIFEQHDDVLNVLHYADSEARSFAEMTNIFEQLMKIGGKNMNMIQLDMDFPDRAAVILQKERRPDLSIILQLSKKTLRFTSKDILARNLFPYGKSIDYVLLDESMGRGVPMNTHDLLLHVEALTEQRYQHGLDFSKTGHGIACAGGLGPNTLHLMEPIIRNYPNISMDAQGALRPSGNAIDPINWDMAEEYLIKALRLPYLS